MQGAEALRILNTIGELEWGRFGLSRDEPAPQVPFLVFRFRDEPEGFAELAKAAVAGFETGVGWVLEKGRRNWVLWPADVRDAWDAGDWRSDSEMFAVFATSSPTICRAAGDEMGSLLVHIARRATALGSSAPEN